MSITDDEPKSMELPDKLGGNVALVQEIYVGTMCPCCSQPSKMYVLEGDYIAVECKKNGRSWLKKSKLPDN